MSRPIFLAAPWRFTYDPSQMCGHVRAKGGGLVCEVWSGRKPDELFVRGNGALIQAAPDLLAVVAALDAECSRAAMNQTRPRFSVLRTLHAQARAALQKAAP